MLNRITQQVVDPTTQQFNPYSPFTSTSLGQLCYTGDQEVVKIKDRFETAEQVLVRLGKMEYLLRKVFNRWQRDRRASNMILLLRLYPTYLSSKLNAAF